MKSLAAFLLALLLGSPVFAANGTIDYRCLALCRANSATPQRCLPHCTYGQTLPSAGKTAAADRKVTANPLDQPAGIAAEPGEPLGHNQFAAPTPATNALLLSSTPSSAPKAKTDYQCLARCEKTGQQFRMCEQECLVSTIHKVANQGLTGTSVGASPGLTR